MLAAPYRAEQGVSCNGFRLRPYAPDLPLFLAAQGWFLLRPEGWIGVVVGRVGMAVVADGEAEPCGKGLGVAVRPVDAFAVPLGPEGRRCPVMQAVKVDADAQAVHGNLPCVAREVLHLRPGRCLPVVRRKAFKRFVR